MTYVKGSGPLKKRRRDIQPGELFNHRKGDTVWMALDAESVLLNLPVGFLPCVALDSGTVGYTGETSECFVLNVEDLK